MNRFASLLTVLLLAAMTAAAPATAQSVRVVADHALPLPAQRAVKTLSDALTAHGFQVTEGPEPAPEGTVSFTIGITGECERIDDGLAQHGLNVPDAPESLLIARIATQNSPAFIVAGRDTRGLVYALLEAAEAVRATPSGGDPLAAVPEMRETPLLRVRSVTTQLFNEELERSWYESEAYWHWFFGMLAANRFNNYTLTFGHNTNYMVPPYAWLFEVPEYPDVRVAGMDNAERERNLRTFQRIGEIAREHGVDFTVGLWTQLPVVAVREGLDYGASPVENLPAGALGGDYCAKGLRRLLELCPAVSGVQLRMNLESGIPEDQQEAYYTSLFDAIANCGRPVRLDMRYKSLSQRTIDLAVAAGLDLTVSTKYWCEHMGLPFHPTWQDPAYSESRYGYGAMLHYPRNYRVVYRLWTVGTSRLLLWGDPEYAARFAESCTMGGGEGFEIFAPLTNKGYGNDPGQWRIFAEPSDEHYTWEYERYWAYFLAFGRYGYNPNTDAVVWERAFAQRFGDVGPHVSRAYREASQILPLISTTTLFSAANWRFWPEMLPCMHLDAYRAIQPSDQAQFYAIAPFSSRQNWRAEGWASQHSAYVEDAIAGNLNSKWTPVEVANRLDELADATVEALDAARAKAEALDTREFDATEMDLRALAHLARYHAEKKRAATHLEFFRLTNDSARLPLVWKHIRQAKSEWEQIVSLTDGMYYDRMVFGFSQEHHSDFLDRLQIHTGHWKDRLPEAQADVDFVAGLLQANGIALDVDVAAAEQSLKRLPGETPLAQKPAIEHERITTLEVGQDLTATARVASVEPLRDVSVYYRAMDQTRPWKRTLMQPTGDGAYTATIPAAEIDPRFDFLYYLEARVAHGGTFWPDWQRETPYVVVQVQR